MITAQNRKKLLENAKIAETTWTKIVCSDFLSWNVSVIRLSNLDMSANHWKPWKLQKTFQISTIFGFH